MLIFKLSVNVGTQNCTYYYEFLTFKSLYKTQNKPMGNLYRDDLFKLGKQEIQNF